MGQPIGGLIQCPIAQLLIFKDQGERIGSELGPLLEQLVDAAGLGLVTVRLVPLEQGLLPLGFGKDFDFTNTPLYVLDHCFKYYLQMIQQSLDYNRSEPPRIKNHRQTKISQRRSHEAQWITQPMVNTHPS